MAEIAASVGTRAVKRKARRRRRNWVVPLLLLPGLLWLVVFYIAPMVTTASLSMQEGNVDEGYVFTGNIGIFAEALQAYWPQLVRSLVYAGIATVLALLLGYPLAYFIAARRGRMKNILLVLVIAPFFTSFLIRTMAWQTFLSSEGGTLTTILHTIGIGKYNLGFLFDWLGTVLHWIGASPNGEILYSPFAVVWGLTYNFLPFMILPLYTSLDRIDGRLLEAAGDLYATPRQTFRHVTWPLSLPGVVSGTLLTFIPASGDFINSRLLGNTNTVMIGQVIDAQFLRVLDYPLASALSFVLLVFILVLVMIYVRRAGTEELV
ncbi:MAG: ABC transporter permease [Intrasporangium sp.]|uniref:ABC transporter permease n=1 Tax=Intrasporangium sp. TaxID=1925024 RepID=UPI003F7F88D4